MWVLSQLLVATDFHSREKNTIEANGTRNCLVTNILQNIVYTVWNNLRVSE